MKKMLTTVFLLTSFSAFSQVTSGEISIGNGQTTVVVSVGSQNSNSTQLNERVRLLERAVRDLQVQVYNLSTQELPSQSLYECSINAFGKVFSGRGETENLARSNAKKSCLKENSSMFCENDDVECSKLK